MIVSQLILAATLLLGLGFTAVYLFRPAWRQRIEQPKYLLQQQLQQLQQLQHSAKSKTSRQNNPGVGGSHES